jgi:hypothetical protein
VVASAAVLAAGCDGRSETTDTAPDTTAPDVTTTVEERDVPVRVYLVRDELVGPVGRTVDAPAVLRGALEELFSGPTSTDRARGLTSAVPEGVSVLGASIANGTATVDLSGSFDDGGGSASMFLRLAQLVHTVTQFPGVERLALRLEGRPVTVFSPEGIELPTTLTRADVEEQAPAILVESPLPGARVSTPLRIRGTANVFEATLEWELRDGTGSRLAGGFTTATCGTGCRGTFSIEHSFSETGPATLRVFERSAKDGSETKVVEIPLVLR